MRLFDEEVTDRLALRSGLAGLSRHQRQVVTLRYLADMPEAEVAEVLGLEVGTVKQHTRRARAALKGALDALQAEVNIATDGPVAPRSQAEVRRRPARRRRHRQSGLAAATLQDITRWEDAFERMDRAQVRPTIFAPNFIGIGRKPQ